MNVIDAMKSRIAAVINDKEPSVSEKLIELATFFYKIDKRVSLEEQSYIDGLLKTIEWDLPLSTEAFHRNCIGKINRIIDEPEESIRLYLTELMQDLSELGATAKAKTIAKEISDADGEIADEEVKYLDLVMSFD
ncbi:MAG: hypothetical protein AAGI72_13290 [Pseudomonadota bacterium]